MSGVSIQDELRHIEDELEVVGLAIRALDIPEGQEALGITVHRIGERIAAVRAEIGDDANDAADAAK